MPHRNILEIAIVSQLYLKIIFIDCIIHKIIYYLYLKVTTDCSFVLKVQNCSKNQRCF